MRQSKSGNLQIKELYGIMLYTYNNSFLPAFSSWLHRLRASVLAMRQRSQRASGSAFFPVFWVPRGTKLAHINKKGLMSVLTKSASRRTHTNSRKQSSHLNPWNVKNPEPSKTARDHHLVPRARLELARFYPADFESATSTIPSHRLTETVVL